jgi:tetratricopeptide (TPR) repeat protein
MWWPMDRPREISTGALLERAGELSIARGTLIGRYQILGGIGHGAMGEVYAAYDPRLDRRVALKLLRASSDADDAATRARLMREAKAMAQLSHRNVVAVHDVGTYEARVSIAMEFVDGLTLTDWLAALPRATDEIVAVFAAAARGLTAAHEAGLVHRDFKPANLMIGRDGSVRVMDFGLARVVSEGPRAREPGDASPVAGPAGQMTLTGELVGTPLYMSPEQLAHGSANARSDQFSFCVALYEALYGAPPFGAGPIESLSERILAGRIDDPPKSTVPAWLRRIVLRGLSVDPAARWPSMSALGAALAHDPARLRRRRAVAAGLASLLALSALAFARGAARPAQLCLDGAPRLADVWEGPEASAGPRPRRDAVERAFLASGASGAREVWIRVSALLDRYRARWLTTYRDACEASNVRHAESAALLELRMICLDERRVALAALTKVLAAADRDAVKSAVSAANALPALERCSDRAALAADVEPPRDEATRARVDGLRAGLATAQALDNTGKHLEARELLQSQLAATRTLGYRPLVAEAAHALARTFRASAIGPEAVALEEEVVWTSLAVGRNDLAATAATFLVFYVGDLLGKVEESRAWAAASEALIDRAGAGHEILRAWLWTNEAAVEARFNHESKALALDERALKLKEQLLGPDDPDLAPNLNNEAEELSALGRGEEALRFNARARDLYIKTYGPASTEAAGVLSNRGEYLVGLGRPAEALEPLRQALALWTADVGDQNPLLGFPLTAMGRALVALGRSPEAVPVLERALRVRTSRQGNPVFAAETRFVLARALWDAGTERSRAVPLAREARAAYARASDDQHAGVIDAWLRSR